MTLIMDEKPEIRDTLASSILFGGLSPEALEAVAGIAQVITIPQDTIIGKMGEKGKAGCIIVSGRVKLSRPGKGGLEPIMKKYPEVTEAVGKGFSLWLQRAGSVIESQAKQQLEPSRFRWIDFIPLLVISVLLGVAFNASNAKGIPLFQKTFTDAAVSFIAPSDIYEKYQKEELLIVDANPSIFFEQEHIKKAMNLPLSTFDFMYDLRLAKTDKSKEIIVYGRTISEHYDEKAAEKLVIRGFEKVKILKGGLSAWKKKNYPVEP
ncbi:MAG: hypothetical protein HY787_08270 [Deltaproteobacteria bacterium]|nr:hypothetical protein [Deltaproteobacteria bacterium]